MALAGAVGSHLLASDVTAVQIEVLPALVWIRFLEVVQVESELLSGWLVFASLIGLRICLSVHQHLFEVVSSTACAAGQISGRGIFHHDRFPAGAISVAAVDNCRAFAFLNTMVRVILIL